MAEHSQNGTALRERHVGELVSRLAQDAGTLVRKEIELARVELEERIETIREDVSATAETARIETAEKLELVRADAGRMSKEAAAGAAMFGTAALAAHLMLGVLSAALVLMLHRWFAADLSALIVGVAWALVAAAAALRGRDRLRRVGSLDSGRYVPRRTIATAKDGLQRAGDVKQALPDQTIETVKEDVQWLKTRGKSDAR